MTLPKIELDGNVLLFDDQVIWLTSGAADVVRLLLAEVEHLTPDPDAPPIPCVEVDPTERDGEMVRTWRCMGEDVRTLGDEWERKIKGGPAHNVGPYPWDAPTEEPASKHERAMIGTVYLVRRAAPPKRTVTVELPEGVVRAMRDGPTPGERMDDHIDAVVAACRAALDGER